MTVGTPPRPNRVAWALAAAALLVAVGGCTPASGTWIATANMDGIRFGHTATLLLDNKVLVAGGSCYPSSDDELASAELYDPTGGS